MSKAKTIYRYTYVGEALRETLTKLGTKMELEEDLQEDLMIKFDEVIIWIT